MGNQGTISICGYTAKVLDEQRFLYITRGPGDIKVVDHNVPKRITAAFIESLASGATRVDHCVSRYCVYDLRSVMQQVRGRYERWTTWEKKDGTWFRSTKIVKTMY